MVLNKVDKIAEEETAMAGRKYKNSVAISALGKLNIGALLLKVEEALAQLIIAVDVRLPLNRMDLVHLAHKEGEVVAENYDEDGVHVHARVPVHLAGLFHQAAISVGE